MTLPGSILVKDFILSLTMSCSGQDLDGCIDRAVRCSRDHPPCNCLCLGAVWARTGCVCCQWAATTKYPDIQNTYSNCLSVHSFGAACYDYGHIGGLGMFHSCLAPFFFKIWKLWVRGHREYGDSWGDQLYGE